MFNATNSYRCITADWGARGAFHFRCTPTVLPVLKRVLPLELQAYAHIVLKLINRNASTDVDVHVSEKLLSCILQWVAEHKYEKTRNEYL